MSLEFTIFKKAFINFIFISINSLSIFNSIMKSSFINYSIRLCQNTFSFFLSNFELTLVNMIIFIIGQLTHTVKFIIFKLSLIICYSLKKQFSFSILFTIDKRSCIVIAIGELICTFFQNIINELSLEFIAIWICKLAIRAMLLSIYHRSNVF